LKIVDVDDRRGSVKVRVEDVDDLWVLKNVINEGDVVISRTLRDVKVDGEGKRRLPMTLAVKVKNVYFQPFSNRLRVHGVIVEGPEEYGLRGSYHTLNVDVGNEVEIVKDVWPPSALRRLSESSKRRFKALLVAADFDEASIATLYGQGIKYLIDLSFKGVNDEEPDAINNISEEICEEVLRYVELEKADFVVVGSPAVLREAIASKLKERSKGRFKIFTDSVSVGGRAGIEELVRRDSVKNLLQEYVIIEAESILNEFMKLLITNPSKVAYGLEHVEIAAANNAVSTLLIHEELLTSENSSRVEELLSKVEEKGGKVRIVPAESPIASKLKGFSGVIAILRYELTID